MSWTTEKAHKYAAKRNMSPEEYQIWLDEQVLEITDFDKDIDQDVAEYLASLHGAVELIASEMADMEATEEAINE